MKAKPVFLLFILVPIISNAQEKLIDFGVGVNPQKSSAAFSFNFSFNRIPSADTKPGPYLWTTKNLFSKDTSDILAIKPSAEGNFGNVESSPNNFLFELGLDYAKKLGRTTRIFIELAPTFNSNKDLDTLLFYGDLGSKFLFHNYPSKVPLYVLPSLNFNVGERFESSESNIFYRIVPGFITSIKFFKERLALSIDAKIFFIFNDSKIVTGGYPLANCSLTYKFLKILGMSFKYMYGYDQPSFKKKEAITLGFTIYR
jgi:hypothetical protein